VSVFEQSLIQIACELEEYGAAKDRVPVGGVFRW
jgi:hypothetical protein